VDLRVDMIGLTGADILVFTSLNGTYLVARTHPATKLTQGTTTALSFHMERAVFFDASDGRCLV
jgi:multiple sugar transport system ATP-binding protein